MNTMAAQANFSRCVNLSTSQTASAEITYDKPLFLFFNRNWPNDWGQKSYVDESNRSYMVGRSMFFRFLFSIEIRMTACTETI